MYSIRDFNSTLFDLVHDLNTALPEHPELSMAESLASTFFQLQPENRMVLDKFWEYAHAHKESIDKQETEVLIGVLCRVVPDPSIVHGIWDALTSENKDTVLAYIQHLYEQARLIVSEMPAEASTLTTGSGAGADAGADAGTDAAAAAALASPSSDTSGTLFLVYNNIWLEFLRYMAGQDEEDDHHGGQFAQTVERVEKLLATKGMSSPVVFELMSGLLVDVLPPLTTFDQQELMKYMVPPSDPIEVLHHDQDALAQKRFVLATSMTMTELLECIITDDDVAKLAMYWHYIKMMTFTLKSCPPELLQVMGNLSQSLVGSLMSGTAA